MDNDNDESLWLEPEQRHAPTMQTSHRPSKSTCDDPQNPEDEPKEEGLDLCSIIDEIAKDDVRGDDTSSGFPSPPPPDQKPMQVCERHSTIADAEEGSLDIAFETLDQMKSYDMFGGRPKTSLDRSANDKVDDSFDNPFDSRHASSFDSKTAKSFESTRNYGRDEVNGITCDELRIGGGSLVGTRNIERDDERAANVGDYSLYAPYNGPPYKERSMPHDNSPCRNYDISRTAENDRSLDHEQLPTFDLASLPSASSGFSSSGSSIFGQLNHNHQYTSPWPSTQAPLVSCQPTIMENEPWNPANQYTDQDSDAISFDFQPQHHIDGDFLFQPMYHPSPQDSPFEPLQQYQHREVDSWQPAMDNTQKDDDGVSDPSDPCYAQLLYRCLKEEPNHTLSLKELYEWVSQHSQKAKDPSNRGWQNSVRHNLSMNAAFKRVSQSESTTGKKGSLWRLTDEALHLGGVISTTRYRKDPKRKPERRTAAPALKRQISGAKGGAATRAATRRNQRLESQQAAASAGGGHTSYPCAGSAVRERQRDRGRRGQHTQMQHHHQQQQRFNTHNHPQQHTPVFPGGSETSRRWEALGMPTPMSATSSLQGSPHPSQHNGLPLHDHLQQRFSLPPPPPPGTVASPYFLSLHGNETSMSPPATAGGMRFFDHTPQRQASGSNQQQQHQNPGNGCGGGGKGIFAPDFELDGPVGYTDGRSFGGDHQDGLQQPETPSSFMTEEGGVGVGGL